MAVSVKIFESFPGAIGQKQHEWNYKQVKKYLEELLNSEGVSTGLPAGGTGGQALKKNSGTDYDAIWATLSKSDVGLSNVDNTSDVNKPVSTAQQTALNLKVDSNSAIAGSTKTKITYDAKGLVTGGADATTADIADSTGKRYVTEDEKKLIAANEIGTANLAIANTETVVCFYNAAANELLAGATFMVEAFCTQAGTNAATPTIRIRVGTTTLTGNIAATLTGSPGSSAVPSVFRGILTIRTVGAGGTASGSLMGIKQAIAAKITPSTGTVAVDTTAAQKIELTFISGNDSNTYTFRNAVIYRVN